MTPTKLDLFSEQLTLPELQRIVARLINYFDLEVTRHVEAPELRLIKSVFCELGDDE